MCMATIGLIEKRQDTGWKIIDKDKRTGILTTPYRIKEMEIGKSYFANGIEDCGIYIFLNKSIAKEFLKKVWKLKNKDTLLAKVELGNNIWKGESNSGSGWNYHFYTTDSIKILSLEE